MKNTPTLTGTFRGQGSKHNPIQPSSDMNLIKHTWAKAGLFNSTSSRTSTIPLKKNSYSGLSLNVQFEFTLCKHTLFLLLKKEDNEFTVRWINWLKDHAGNYLSCHTGTIKFINLGNDTMIGCLRFDMNPKILSHRNVSKLSLQLSALFMINWPDECQ